MGFSRPWVAALAGGNGLRCPKRPARSDPEGTVHAGPSTPPRAGTRP